MRCFVTALPRQWKAGQSHPKTMFLSRPKTIHKQLKSFHMSLEATWLRVPECHASINLPSQRHLASFWCLFIFGTSNSKLPGSWELAALWDGFSFYFLAEELAWEPANPPGPDSKGWKFQSEWVLACHLELMEKNTLSLAGQVEAVDVQIFVSPLVLP